MQEGHVAGGGAVLQLPQGLQPERALPGVQLPDEGPQQAAGHR